MALTMAWSSDYHRIPQGVRDALDRYVTHGISPGSFTRAVLENDLFEALGRGDLESTAALPAICGYVYNELPSDCWGSPEKVVAWIAEAERRLQEKA